MHQVAVLERDSAPFQVFLVTGMEASTDDDRLGFGKMGHGCKHYRRRCKVRASCCNGIFSCRHCHDDSTDWQEICRFDVETVICSICDTEQTVTQICSNCGVNMGEYFCGVCRFYDDDIEKAQDQCSDCGICRVAITSIVFVLLMPTDCLME